MALDVEMERRDLPFPDTPYEEEKVPGLGLEPALAIQPGRWCRKPLDHESSASARQYSIESRANQT